MTFKTFICKNVIHLKMNMSVVPEEICQLQYVLYIPYKYKADTKGRSKILHVPRVVFALGT